MDMKRKKIIVFTGAGVSAESGLKTFRDSGGLWENYKIEEVATPQAWEKNSALVLDFYNQRRKQCMNALPNDAHKALVRLEEKYDVQIITQNIDDLHERAGSKKIIHLHGEITKARSTFNESLIYPIIGTELNLGQFCENGYQLRPHIVWFGEAVPMMDEAIKVISYTDILIIIGTSLNVYPAAGLVDYAPISSSKYYIDPHATHISHIKNLSIINKTACDGVVKLVDTLLKEC